MKVLLKILFAFSIVLFATATALAAENSAALLPVKKYAMFMHKENIYFVAFSPDGRKVLTESDDNTPSVGCCGRLRWLSMTVTLGI